MGEKGNFTSQFVIFELELSVMHTALHLAVPVSECDCDCAFTVFDDPFCNYFMMKSKLSLFDEDSSIILRD